MRSNARSSATASCAIPANASSTPIAASASTPSRTLFMADVLRFRNDDPNEEPAGTLDAFLDQESAREVWIAVGEATRRLLPPTGCAKRDDMDVPSLVGKCRWERKR